MTAATSTPSANERWSEVVGYEGVYEVSTHGRVKRVLKTRGAKLRFKKPVLNKKNGYLVVSLWANNVGETCYVHRMVAQAFIDGDFALTVNHIDGNKLNNHVGNLEWATLAENTRHQHAIGLANISGQYKPSKISIEDRAKIRARYLAGEKQIDIAKDYNCSQPLISWVCQREMF